MTESENPIRIFVGSSKESVEMAYAIQAALDDFAEVTVWDQKVFKPSHGSVNSLEDFLRKDTDFAIMVYTPDDEGTVRDKKVQMARDNVILELGLCVGCLGMKNTFIFMPRGANDFSVPSDLDGITILPFTSNRKDQNYVAAMTPGCQTVKEAILKLTPKKNVVPKSSRTPAIEKILDNSAEPLKKIIHPIPEEEKIVSLKEKEIEIISFLGTQAGNKRRFPSEISSFLGIHETKTQYYLDNLLEKQLIYDHLNYIHGTSYSLSKLGRKFFVENKLFD